MSEQQKPTLTQGQASCLILGLEPTEKNRKKAKELMKTDSILEVTYKRNGDPFEPIAVGKKLIRLNPFLYKSYPPTPPRDTSTQAYKAYEDHISISSAEDSYDYYTIQSEEEESNAASVASNYHADYLDGIYTQVVKKEQVSEAEGGRGKATESSPYGKEQEEGQKLVMDFVKRVFIAEKPDNVHKYMFTWVSAQSQLEVVTSHIEFQSLTSKKLEGWICQDGCLGKKMLKEVKEYGPQYGRYLYVLKQKYRGMVLFIEEGGKE